MSSHRRIRKLRSVRTSHFVEDVTMCALNDPLPPYHPETPPLDMQVPNTIYTYYSNGPIPDSQEEFKTGPYL